MAALFGVIFDWDGVIIDSSAAHEESWERLAKEEHLVLPADHFKKGFGMKNELIIPDLLGWAHEWNFIRRLSLRKEALYRDIVREKGLELLAGVHEWLDLLRNHAIPCVIGSSTQRENIDLSLGILGIAGYFTGVITGDDVVRGKPDPEIFLKAAGLAGVPPQRCVVFEDTPVGIDAARAGGMKVIGIEGTHPAERLSKADLVVTRMDSLTIGRVGDLFTTANNG
jgi:HAD superfamily hydrolase (TIGR01509 family)